MITHIVDWFLAFQNDGSKIGLAFASPDVTLWHSHTRAVGAVGILGLWRA